MTNIDVTYNSAHYETFVVQEEPYRVASKINDCKRFHNEFIELTNDVGESIYIRVFGIQAIYKEDDEDED